MIWQHDFLLTPKKFKASSSEGKLLEKGDTITGSYFADQIKRLREAMKLKRRGTLRAGVFHQDVAVTETADLCFIGCQSRNGIGIGRTPPLFSRSIPQQLVSLSSAQGNISGARILKTIVDIA
ncbi:unnamed protein product [Leptosia nina]|uniref:Uncharacterized protein n=1 Tax=Leptosia nina TaxID=320188 RepID=A0AAV1J4M4_9NEOP